jgi:phenylpyruvate tautomerase PptA (4-oxalocrotonate tautomerase family)
VQVLTNAGALDRDKQLAVVAQLTKLVAAAAGDPSLTGRTWVLLTEAAEGGWGLAGHAHTNTELVTAARTQLAEIAARLRARKSKHIPQTGAGSSVGLQVGQTVAAHRDTCGDSGRNTLAPQSNLAILWSWTE